MFYRFNQISSRIQAANAALNAQPAPKVGEVTHIPAYTAASSGSTTGANRIAQLQVALKSSGQDLPVFLRGAGDLMAYRGIMVFSVIGIGLSFYTISKMATGSMQKKQN